MPLPANDAITRLTQNEERFDKFINGTTTETYTTNEQVPRNVETISKFLARMEALVQAGNPVNLKDLADVPDTYVAGSFLRILGGVPAFADASQVALARANGAGVIEFTASAYGATEVVHVESGTSLNFSFSNFPLQKDYVWLIYNHTGGTLPITSAGATAWTGVFNNADGTTTLPTLTDRQIAVIHVAFNGADRFLNVMALGAGSGGGAWIKGDWNLTPTTATLPASAATAVGGVLTPGNPGGPNTGEVFDITTGGVSLLSGAAFGHSVASATAASVVGGTRRSSLRANTFAPNTGQVNVILIAYAEASVSTADLMVAMTGGLTTTVMTFFAFGYQPGSTANVNFVSRNNSATTNSEQIALSSAWANDDVLSLRMNFDTGVMAVVNNAPSAGTASSSTASLTPANMSGKTFVPRMVVMTFGVDDTASSQLIEFNFTENWSTTTGFVGSADAAVPAGSVIGDGYRVIAAGPFGGKTAEVGDTVVLHPTLTSIQVFKSTRGLNDAEVVAKGYQTAAQVVATAETTTHPYIDISVNTDFAEAHRSKTLIVRNLTTMTFAAAAPFANGWWTLVQSGTFNVTLHSTSATVRYTQQDTDEPAAATAAQTLTMPPNETWLLWKNPADADRILVMRLRSALMQRATRITRRTAGFNIAEADFLRPILADGTANLDIYLQAQGDAAYSADFRTTLTNVNNSIAITVRVSSASDSINDTLNGTYVVGPLETVGIIKNANGDWYVGSGGRLRGKRFESYYQTSISSNNSGTHSPDWGSDNVERITLTGNLTISPNNPGGNTGDLYTKVLRIIQDSTGGYTVSYTGASFGDQTTPVMPTTASTGEMWIQLWMFAITGAVARAAVLWRSA